MSGIETLHVSDEVEFGRDCEATQIPSGVRIVVPKGTPAYVGQTLGGNVTLQISTLGLDAQHTRHNVVNRLHSLRGWWCQDMLQLRSLSLPNEVLVKQHGRRNGPKA